MKSRIRIGRIQWRGRDGATAMLHVFNGNPFLFVNLKFKIVKKRVVVMQKLLFLTRRLVREPGYNPEQPQIVTLCICRSVSKVHDLIIGFIPWPKVGAPRNMISHENSVINSIEINK
jgi:hypothetical protein